MDPNLQNCGCTTEANTTCYPDTRELRRLGAMVESTAETLEDHGRFWLRVEMRPDFGPLLYDIPSTTDNTKNPTRIYELGHAHNCFYIMPSAENLADIELVLTARSICIFALDCRPKFRFPWLPNVASAEMADWQGHGEASRGVSRESGDFLLSVSQQSHARWHIRHGSHEALMRHKPIV